jgi:TonB-linked SusC/RagA family outer membrane protein
MHSYKLYGLAVPAAALLLAVTLTPATAQQTGTIRGTVVSAATQRPVVGARVSIQGSNIGTVTNEAGRFELLNLNPGPYGVRVQYIGYSPVTQTTTLQAGLTATLDFSLMESAIQLEEVVVTGTAAEVRKKEVGNSTESIAPREIQVAPLINSQDVLVGRAPGVTVMESSGQPGSGGTIKVRGVNTVSQSIQPLIYVDGVRIANNVHSVGGNGGRTGVNPLQDINVDDIDRVEVIKGAAATTLYGTEASGGVLQIFTKQGSVGAPVWNLEVSGGGTLAPRLGKNDPTQFYMACGDTSVMYGIAQTAQTIIRAPGDTLRFAPGDRIYFTDPTCPASGHWQQMGPSASTALSVRGGNERVTYYVSGNYNNADGYLQTGASKEGGFRGNFTFSPATALKLSLNTAYQRRDTRWVADGNNAAGFLLNVARGPAGNFRGGKGTDCTATGPGVDLAKVCFTNVYVFEAENLSKSDHFTTGFTINYDPMENLFNRFSVGWDFTDQGDNVTRPFGHFTTPAGSFRKGDTRHTKLSLDYAGSLNNHFGSSISSSFSWGAQLFRDQHKYTAVTVTTFAGPGDVTLQSGATTTGLADSRFAGTNAGFLLQELLGLQDRLFVTAGLRVDGNSAFGTNFGLQPYPKLSVAWVLSDYGFFPKGSAFETFKLRGAIGQAGKAPGAFDKLRTWTPVSADGGSAGFAPNNIGNPDVGPERTTETELGFDAGFLSGHLGIEFTAFRAKTVDALVPVNLPASQGFLADRIQNVGDLQNEGLEASVNLGLITARDLDWRVRASGSLLRSKVLKLGPGSEEDPIAHMIYTGLNSYMKVGEPAPAYYAQWQVTNPNEYADPIIYKDSLAEIGPVFPTKQFSLGTTLSLMDRVTLDGLWEFQGGMYAQNYTGQQSARRGASWECLAFQELYFKGGDISGYTALQRARCAPNTRVDWYDIAWWTEKADFWKLRSLSLSYRLPEKLLPMGKSGTLTVAGRNLFTLTDYTGTDPESNDVEDAQGTGSDSGTFGRRDYYQIPPGRTLIVSLRLTF